MLRQILPPYGLKRYGQQGRIVCCCFDQLERLLLGLGKVNLYPFRSKQRRAQQSQFQVRAQAKDFHFEKEDALSLTFVFCLVRFARECLTVMEWSRSHLETGVLKRK